MKPNNAFRFARFSICDGEAYTGFILKNRLYPLFFPDNTLPTDFFLSWLFPSHLEYETAVLGGGQEALEQVLEKNTLLPAFRRFLSPKDSKLLRDFHVETGPNPTRFIGQLMKSSSILWSPGICLQCLREDIAPDGRPFWRRDFLFTIIGVCSKHKARIFDLCDECRYKIRANGRVPNLTSPGPRCACGRELKPRLNYKGNEAILQCELDFAKGWSKLLDSRFARDTSRGQIISLINNKAIALGLIGALGVNIRKFMDVFSSTEFSGFLASLSFPFASPCIRRSLRGITLPDNPIFCLLLLITLFGSWDDAETALLLPPPTKTNTGKRSTRRVSETRKSNPNKYKKALCTSIQLLPETRLLYNRLRRKYPHLPHSQLRRLLPFPHGLAASLNRLKAHGLKVSDKQQAFDTSLSKHIRHRFIELVASRVSYRLSTARLINGHAYRSNSYINAHLPKSAAALRKYHETSLECYLRRLRDIIQCGRTVEVKNFGRKWVKDLTLKEAKAIWDDYRYRQRKSEVRYEYT